MSRTTIMGIDLLKGMLCAFKNEIFENKFKRIADSYFGVSALPHGVRINASI